MMKEVTKKHKDPAKDEVNMAKIKI